MGYIYISQKMQFAANGQFVIVLRGTVRRFYRIYVICTKKDHPSIQNMLILLGHTVEK